MFPATRGLHDHPHVVQFFWKIFSYFHCMSPVNRILVHWKWDKRKLTYHDFWLFQDIILTWPPITLRDLGLNFKTVARVLFSTFWRSFKCKRKCVKRVLFKKSEKDNMTLSDTKRPLLNKTRGFLNGFVLPSHWNLGWVFVFRQV